MLDEKTIIDRDATGDAFHHGLQCSVRAMTYSFRERRGRLDTEEGCCCDMIGCIALFAAIDPEVREIETFAGEERDTAYVRRPKGWACIRPDGVVMGVAPHDEVSKRLRMAMTLPTDQTPSWVTQ